MPVEKMKSIIFVILLILIVGLIAALIVNAEVFYQNMVSIFIIIVFLFVIWKYDFVIMLKDYERAVIFRFGKVNRVGGPGWALIFPVVESFAHVDLRTQTIDIPKQDVVTKDSIELKIDAVIYLSVARNPQAVVNSVIEVRDYRKASQLFVISLIRDVIGSFTLSDVISNIEGLNKELTDGLEKISMDWGVKVEGVEIKDVDIPRTVIDAMHEEKAAVQQKLARMEKALAHKAEIEAVKAATVDMDEKALSYFYLKALEKMADGKATKILFPVEVTRLAGLISGKIAGTGTGKKKEKFDFDKLAGYEDEIKELLGEPKKKKGKKKETEAKE